jgi:hypothetical protein
MHKNTLFRVRNPTWNLSSNYDLSEAALEKVIFSSLEDALESCLETEQHFRSWVMESGKTRLELQISLHTIPSVKLNILLHLTEPQFPHQQNKKAAQ